MAKTRSANALDLLREDHDKVRKLFEKSQNVPERELEDIAHKVTEALERHMQMEEKVFYPWLRSATDRVDLVEEAFVEHAAAKDLLADLDNAEGVRCRAILKVLSEYVGHHIDEEEGKIFPLVEALGVDLDALGTELAEQRKDPRREPQWAGSTAPRAETKSGGRR